MNPAGLPHSDIHGSMPAYGSPWLFAVRCVLHRLLMPRHSPCALCSLTISGAELRSPGPLLYVILLTSQNYRFYPTFLLASVCDGRYPPGYRFFSHGAFLVFALFSFQGPFLRTPRDPLSGLPQNPDVRIQTHFHPFEPSHPASVSRLFCFF